MRRLLWPFILSLVRASGCLPRERFNKNCEWTLDASRRLDLNDPRDREHLIQDAQLAEELATRYSDFKAKQVTGYEGHGGYLEQGRVTTGCRNRLFSEIERIHGVTPQQIAEARGHRDGRFDLAVILSFAVFYVLATRWVCRSLARRFGHHGERVWGVAVVSSSVLVGLVGVELLGFWSMSAEMIRIGNDHVGASRAAKIPWGNHFTAVFVGAIVVFWLIAWLRRPVTSADEEAPSDLDIPQGVLFR